MRLFKLVLPLLLSCLFFIGCDSFRIEKRKYMKGFSISTSRKNFDVPEKKKIPVSISVSSVSKNQDSLPYNILVGSATTFLDVKKSGKSENSFASQEKGKNFESFNKVDRSFQFGHNEIGSYEKVFLQEGWRNDSSRRANYFLIGLTALFGASFFAFMKFKKKYAINLSRWAQKSKVKSRLLMGAIQLFIGVGAHFAGGLFYDLGFTVTDVVRNIIAGGFLATLVLYPVQKRRNFIFSDKNYMKNKVFEFALIFTGSLLAVCSGNKAAERYQTTIYEQSFGHSKQNTNSLFEKALHLDSFSNRENMSEEGREALKGFLIALTILSVLILEILLVVLACYLICSDQVGLAALALIGGTALLVVAAIFTIKSIKNIPEDSPSVPTL